jgi:hypothetical protein
MGLDVRYTRSDSLGPVRLQVSLADGTEMLQVREDFLNPLVCQNLNYTHNIRSRTAVCARPSEEQTKILEPGGVGYLRDE